MKYSAGVYSLLIHAMVRIVSVVFIRPPERRSCHEWRCDSDAMTTRSEPSSGAGFAS